MKAKWLFTLVVTVVTTTASANDKGNGGKGVYCPQADGSTKLLVLDYDRAVREWGLNSPSFPAEGNEVVKALEIVRRLAGKDPYRLNLYEVGIKRFYREASIVDNFDIDETPDSHQAGICEGGKISQVIVQSSKDKPWNRNYAYLIHKKRWMDADVDQRAGFIIHEVILSEGLSVGNWKESTDAAMWFNALLATRKIDDYGMDQYAELLRDKAMDLPVFDKNLGWFWGYHDRRKVTLYLNREQARQTVFKGASLFRASRLKPPGLGELAANGFDDELKRSRWEAWVNQMDAQSYLRLTLSEEFEGTKIQFSPSEIQIVRP
jgi:hypothetical protein